jgi:hypothetical protein
MEGWIKLHRKTLENPIIMQDKEYLAVWIFLLLNATHSEYDTKFQGKRITLQKGQLITGRKVIAKKLDISESKVQRILKTFENEHQIEQQTTHQNRLVSILNWDMYQQQEQQQEQQVNSKRTTSEQQVNTNKNDNNINNTKNGKNGNNNRSVQNQETRMHFAEFVSMTNVEYEKLVNTYGKSFADQCIKKLDDYKGATGKNYKSDYRAILSWVVDEIKEKRSKKSKGGIDDFKELMEEAKNEQRRNNTDSDPFGW